MALTAGIGSDHVDLQAACDKKITVAEITGSNVVSVAEHVVMMILGLVRNYIPAYQQVVYKILIAWGSVSEFLFWGFSFFFFWPFTFNTETN